jgi:hypothetical protein
MQLKGKLLVFFKTMFIELNHLKFTMAWEGLHLAHSTYPEDSS